MARYRAFSLTWPAATIGSRHQHGRRFIVLKHQHGCRDVIWNLAIVIISSHSFHWFHCIMCGISSGNNWYWKVQKSKTVKRRPSEYFSWSRQVRVAVPGCSSCVTSACRRPIPSIKMSKSRSHRSKFIPHPANLRHSISFPEPFLQLVHVADQYDLTLYPSIPFFRFQSFEA